MDEQKPRANRLDALPLLFHFTKVGQSVGWKKEISFRFFSPAALGRIKVRRVPLLVASTLVYIEGREKKKKRGGSFAVLK